MQPWQRIGVCCYDLVVARNRFYRPFEEKPNCSSPRRTRRWKRCCTTRRRSEETGVARRDRRHVQDSRAEIQGVDAEVGAWNAPRAPRDQKACRTRGADEDKLQTEFESLALVATAALIGRSAAEAAAPTIKSHSKRAEGYVSRGRNGLTEDSRREWSSQFACTAFRRSGDRATSALARYACCRWRSPSR